MTAWRFLRLGSRSRSEALLLPALSFEIYKREVHHLSFLSIIVLL